MGKKKNKEKNIHPDTPKKEPMEKKDFTDAHEQAEKDIENDPDLNTSPHREDDLDEGELAQLEGED